MSGRPRVLIVDDDPTIRRLVAGLLVERGYDAQTALDGEHALRSAAALQPDLIILDIHVPETAGALRFAEVYRERVPADRRAPIIAMSGASDLHEIGQQLGASAFIEKPFDVDELLRTIAKLLPEPIAAADPAPTTEPAPDGTETMPSVQLEPGTSPT